MEKDRGQLSRQETMFNKLHWQQCLWTEIGGLKTLKRKRKKKKIEEKKKDKEKEL